MTKLQTSIIKLSQEILDYLLVFKEKKPEFTFSLRERDSAQSAGVKRLSVGYWFQGSTYIYVPLFKIGDSARKIKTIGFVIAFDEIGNVVNNYIEISFKGVNFNSDEVKFHKELANYIKLNLGQNNHGIRAYETKDVLKNLDNYITDFRDYALTLLEKYNLKEKYIVKEIDFQKRLKKINEIKLKLNTPQPIVNIVDQDLKNSKKKYNGNLNEILYGPPGTGKTHRMKHYYLPHFVQNQRKISKEEFVINKVSKLTWWQVIALTLYVENKAMSVPEIKVHNFIKIKLNVSNSVSLDQTIWGQLSQHTIEESETVDYSKRTFPLIFNKNEQSVWSLERNELIQDICDLGDNIKSYIDISETKNNYDFITFHQSYAYEDFVEGIKPNLDDQNQDSSEVNYRMKDGIFYKCCDEAVKLAGFSSLSDCILNYSREQRIEKFNNAAPYALFIDEINRGNVSAIFGELITLIESEKRLSKDEIIVQLPYSNRYFSVPPNLYIIGTMNTADRSIESLDTALRRRFCFEEIMPETGMLTPSAMYCNLLWDYKDLDWDEEPFVSAEKDLFDLLGVPQSLFDERKSIWDEMKKEKTPDNLTYFDSYNEDFSGINLESLLTIINNRIEILLDRDHTIGHSYFMKIKNLDDLKNTFKNNIIPLLQEYFYGDYEKIGMVLGNGFFEQTKKINKSVFAKFDSTNYPDNSKIFKLKKIDSEFDVVKAIEQLTGKSDNKNDVNE